jgi:2-polyprenyl-3-methyl-5-hydroxy-6-metoxy-1,4-benzoquinol methylase
MSKEIEEADKRLFDEIAENYVRKDLTPYCRIARKLRLDRTLKNTQQPIPSLLEVGCGGGFTADYLKGRYNAYTGVDYSENLIAYAMRYNSSSKTRFVCKNINDFDSTEKFQIILMIGVLHHIPEPEKVLKHLMVRLEQKGVVVVNEPQKGNPIIGLLRKIRKKIDSKYSSDQVEFSERELRAMFTKCGYKVRTFPQGILSTPLAETRLLPNIMGLPLAWLVQFIDPVLDILFALPILRNLAWNIVVEARVSSSNMHNAI